jgi:maleate isomerase
VVSIDGPSIITASTQLMQGTKVDGLFLSCTNLRTLDVIASLEAALGRPVLSSNLVLAWHMLGARGDPRDLLCGL